MNFAVASSDFAVLIDATTALQLSAEIEEALQVLKTAAERTQRLGETKRVS